MPMMPLMFCICAQVCYNQCRGAVAEFKSTVSSSDCELQAAVVQTEETHETLADMEGKLTAAIAQLNGL